MNEVKGNGLSLFKIDVMINYNICEVFFDNFEILVDMLIGEEGKGFCYIVDSMNVECILIVYECIGDVKFFIEKVIGYVSECVVFGWLIGVNQGIQFLIVKVYVEVQVVELMVIKVVIFFDSGVMVVVEVNMVKFLVVDVFWQVVEMCMQVYGGFVFVCEYGIECKWWEVWFY